MIYLPGKLVFISFFSFYYQPATMYWRISNTTLYNNNTSLSKEKTGFDLLKPIIQ